MRWQGAGLDQARSLSWDFLPGEQLLRDLKEKEVQDSSSCSM